MIAMQGARAMALARPGATGPWRRWRADPPPPPRRCGALWRGRGAACRARISHAIDLQRRRDRARAAQVRAAAEASMTPALGATAHAAPGLRALTRPVVPAITAT